MDTRYRTKIICVITTKNRIDLFKRASKSVASQKRAADEILVISDSEVGARKKEEKICKEFGFELLKDEYSHNYAGSLNTALYHIIEINYRAVGDFKNIYVAFLDDDDTWSPEYLSECEAAAKDGVDFVVSGIVHYDGKTENRLSIPVSLCIEDFLIGNPHIQGSNTFVKLETLLRAGMFDENMPSTTDRDLFVRIMMLEPIYSVIDKHLVYVDADKKRPRVTNSASIKTDGLAKFYHKYSGMMSDEVKGCFFERAESLFSITKADIIGRLAGKSPDASIADYSSAEESSDKKFEGRIVVGFIATSYDLGLRLLKELVGLKRPNTKIVIFMNNARDWPEYIDALRGSVYECEIFRLADIREEAIREKVIKEDYLSDESEHIGDIAVSRSILQFYLHNHTSDGDAIWVLDDDMELKKVLAVSDGFSVEMSDDVDRVIERYWNKFDAVIGEYTLDPPLPVLSTIRTSLLDYVYNNVCKIEGDGVLVNRDDYYYDLSEQNTTHLETPLKYRKSHTLDEIFSGKATSRPLYVDSSAKEREAKSRGGITLIFNRELLRVPNWSNPINDAIGRRSDYFWVLLSKEKGYKIEQVNFGVMHNRAIESFDYADQTDKLIKDFIGAAFTHAIEAASSNSTEDAFYTAYRSFFYRRLSKYIASHYRVEGLLSILGDDSYRNNFSPDNLMSTVWKCMPYLDEREVKFSYSLFKQDKEKYFHLNDCRWTENLLKEHVERPDEIRFLGFGEEGIVYTDYEFAYKFFYEKSDELSFMIDKSKFFKDCPQLDEAEFSELGGMVLMKRKYADGTSYKGGYARELASFLNFCKTHGFTFVNFKKENIVDMGSSIKIVDYGKCFARYDEAVYERSVKRAFEMVRYSFLSDYMFKRIIRLSYDLAEDGIPNALDYGWEAMRTLTENRTKEQIHDEKALKLVKKYNPAKILDYGAGKCRIANELSEDFDVAVYDVDLDIVNERARDKVKIFDDPQKIPKDFYDVVLCNLVLCSVPNDVANQIMTAISVAVKKGGHVILSVCDSFFSTVSETEIRMNGISGRYDVAEEYTKRIMVGSGKRSEFYRPIDYYVNLFQRYGLRIDSTCECDAVDADTVMPISEYRLFDLSCEKATELKDCSLLIKTNPMEADCIYDGISHIVRTLEKGCRFRERVVVADMTASEGRSRTYHGDDPDKLKSELSRAQINGLVDRVVFATDDDAMPDTYLRYFGVESRDGHSTNGQGLYATLVGFDSINTRYVFQTDSDIIYYSTGSHAFDDFYNEFRSSNTVTASPSIAHSAPGNAQYGKRTEVRCCMLDLDKLRGLLPISNGCVGGKIELTWNRALDRAMEESDGVRFSSSDFWFLHPSNEQKWDENFIAYVRESLEEGFFDESQRDNVDLQGDCASWVQCTDADVIVYLRGCNTPCEKVKGALDSLAMQTVQDYFVVYVDDASSNESAEYAKFALRYDERFKGKSIFVGNGKNRGALANFVFAMERIVKNPNAVVINLDNDDCFTDERAIELILKQFNEGADLTCGNCLRFDKPYKKYSVASFERVWERDGDNIWLHPKCFKRYLFDSIDVEDDLKMGGKFVDVDTDFAMMLPMIEHAKKCSFIDRQIYLFEPSIENSQRVGKYSDDNKRVVKNYLLAKAKEKHRWKAQEEKL